MLEVREVYECFTAKLILAVVSEIVTKMPQLCRQDSYLPEETFSVSVWNFSVTDYRHAELVFEISLDEITAQFEYGNFEIVLTKMFECKWSYKWRFTVIAGLQKKRHKPWCVK